MYGGEFLSDRRSRLLIRQGADPVARHCKSTGGVVCSGGSCHRANNKLYFYWVPVRRGRALRQKKKDISDMASEDLLCESNCPTTENAE